MSRKKIMFLITIPVVTILAYFAIGQFFYHFALNANASTSRNVGEKVYVPSVEINEDRESIEKEKDRTFLQTIIPKEKSITSHDGLTLKGYEYIQPTPTNTWILAVHGYTGSARQMTRWNRQMYELGYNILAPDLRGHGQSEGNYYGMGWLDQKDLKQWLQLLVDTHPDANIVLYGVSMGASAVLNLAASEADHQNVKAVIADSGFTSVAEIFETQLNETLHLPSFPIMNAANTVAKLRIDLDFYDASTVELVPTIQVPIFYIHGGADTFVPVDNVYKLAEVTTTEYECWVVEEANHGEAVKVEPDEYKKRLQSFIEAQLN